MEKIDNITIDDDFYDGNEVKTDASISALANLKKLKTSINKKEKLTISRDKYPKLHGLLKALGKTSDEKVIEEKEPEVEVSVVEDVVEQPEVEVPVVEETKQETVILSEEQKEPEIETPVVEESTAPEVEVPVVEEPIAEPTYSFEQPNAYRENKLTSTTANFDYSMNNANPTDKYIKDLEEAEGPVTRKVLEIGVDELKGKDAEIEAKKAELSSIGEEEKRIKESKEVKRKEIEAALKEKKEVINKISEAVNKAKQVDGLEQMERETKEKGLKEVEALKEKYIEEQQAIKDQMEKVRSEIPFDLKEEEEQTPISIKNDEEVKPDLNDADDAIVNAMKIVEKYDDFANIDGYSDVTEEGFGRA